MVEYAVINLKFIHNIFVAKHIFKLLQEPTPRLPPTQFNPNNPKLTDFLEFGKDS